MAEATDKANSERKVHKVVIVGTGPCGLTAALYTARANLEPLVLEGDIPGGQLTTTSVIENYPGFENGIDGTELVQTMKKQAAHFGAKFEYFTVNGIDASSRPFKISLQASDDVLLAEVVIVATGASPRKLGIASEEKYWTAGVTSCATCDGAFYKGREVIVIGGGDSAMEEALFLTNFCTKVTLVHRREEFRASKIMSARALAHPKIQTKLNSTIEEILANDSLKGIKVTGVRLKDTKTGKEEVFPTGGVFLAIGHIPNTSFLKGVIPLDEEGYAVTKPNSTKTDVAGLFVAGDAQDRVFRQAITAAGSGCMAAIEAERYLEEIHSKAT